MNDNEPRENQKAHDPLVDGQEWDTSQRDGSTHHDGSENTSNPEHDSPDPAFIAMLEQFRDETPAEQVFKIQTAPEPTAEPQSIGRFTILRQLGQGGYGVVFLAQDPNLNRLVALKVPRPEVLVTTQLRERFLREGRAAAALNHAHVVPVFEAGHAGPVCYIASAYCDGPNLDQWQQDHETRLDDKQTAKWVQQLADAVQHAHSRGILHRDLKPSNILMAPVAELESESTHSQWIPQVTDFGLAHVADGSADQTRSDAVLGTPGYMAPEQASGQARSAGPATDVYALGGILYFLLTGEPPILRETPVLTLQAVVNDEPKRPSRQRPGVPRDLEAICLQCLEKDPRRRYESASELSEDLQRFLDDAPVRARRITSWERTIRWCGKNRRIASLLAALLFTLVVATIGMTHLWREAVTEGKRSERTAGELRVKTDQLQGAIDRLFSAIADSPEIRLVGAEPLRRRLLAEVKRYVTQFLAQEPSDPELRYQYAQTMYRFAEIHDVLGDHKSAIELTEQAIAQLTLVDGKTTNTFEDAKSWTLFLANRKFRYGQFDAARELYRETLDIDDDIHNLPARQQRAIATAWSDLAASEMFAADTKRATAAARQARNIWQRLGIDDSPHVNARQIIAYAQCQRTLGQISEMTGDPTASQAYYQEAIDLLAPHLTLDCVDVIDLKAMHASCQHGLGIAFGMQKQFDAAREHYEAAREAFQLLIDQHPSVYKYQEDIAGVWYSFAVTQMLTQNYDDAVTLVTQAAEQMHVLADKYPDKRLTLLDRCGKHHNLLYVAYSRQQRYSEAHEAIEKAMALYQTVLDERPEWLETKIALAEATGNFGNLLSNQEQYQAALDKYEEARRLIEPIHRQQPEHGRARQTFISSYTGPVALYTKTSQYDLALGELQKLLQLVDDRPTVSDRLHEVWLLDRLSRYDKARAAMDLIVANHTSSPADAKMISDKAKDLRERHLEAGSDQDDYVVPPKEYLSWLANMQ